LNGGKEVRLSRFHRFAGEKIKQRNHHWVRRGTYGYLGVVHQRPLIAIKKVRGGRWREGVFKGK